MKYNNNESIQELEQKLRKPKTIQCIPANIISMQSELALRMLFCFSFHLFKLHISMSGLKFSCDLKSSLVVFCIFLFCICVCIIICNSLSNKIECLLEFAGENASEFIDGCIRDRLTNSLINLLPHLCWNLWLIWDTSVT